MHCVCDGPIITDLERTKLYAKRLPRDTIGILKTFSVQDVKRVFYNGYIRYALRAEPIIWLVCTELESVNFQHSWTNAYTR